MSNSSIDWKSRPTKFWWLIRLRMSKCHLKGTDIEDIRLRVESNPDLISLCDWSRKLMPIHRTCTFKTNTNRNWLAFSPGKSFSLVFSLGWFSNWLLWLLWVWSYDNQSKRTLERDSQGQYFASMTVNIWISCMWSAD